MVEFVAGAVTIVAGFIVGHVLVRFVVRPQARAQQFGYIEGWMEATVAFFDVMAISIREADDSGTDPFIPGEQVMARQLARLAEHVADRWGEDEADEVRTANAAFMLGFLDKLGEVEGRDQ